MKRNKKSTKAVTLLSRIETLLSDVLDECAAIEKTVEKQVRKLLVAAGESIAEAKEFVVNLPASPEVRHRATKSRKRVAQHLGTKRKARPSVRAKKRAEVRAA